MTGVLETETVFDLSLQDDWVVSFTAYFQPGEPWWCHDERDESPTHTESLRRAERFLAGFDLTTIQSWQWDSWQRLLAVFFGREGEAGWWLLNSSPEWHSPSEALARENERRLATFSQVAVAEVLDGLDLTSALRQAITGVLERVGAEWLEPLRGLQEQPDRLGDVFAVLDRTGEATGWSEDESETVEAVATRLAPEKATRIRQMGRWTRALERLRAQYLEQLKRSGASPELRLRLADGRVLGGTAEHGGAVARGVEVAREGLCLTDRFTIEMTVSQPARLFLLSIPADPMERPRVLAPGLAELGQRGVARNGVVSFPSCWGIDAPLRLDPQGQYGERACETFVLLADHGTGRDWVTLEERFGALPAVGVVARERGGQDHPCWLDGVGLAEDSGWSVGLLQVPVKS